MEEIISYFEKLEKRLSALEAAEAKKAAQEELIEALKRRVVELQTLTTALSARNIQLENRLSALETHQQTLVTTVTDFIQQSACPSNAPANESEEIKLDEETGLPELEVEFIDEPEEETTEVFIEKEMKVADIPAEKEQEVAPLTEVATAATAEVVDIVAASAEAEPVVETASPKQAVEMQEAAPAEAIGSLVPKVEDIRKGITMGDRFLFQRELFGNNGELMNKTIDALNKLSSLEEAMAYTQQKFPNWNKESNAYELFTNLLKRRW